MSAEKRRRVGDDSEEGGAAADAAADADAAAAVYEYTCPLTKVAVRVPVCSEVGSVYEAEAWIAQWPHGHNDPATGLPLLHWNTFVCLPVDLSLVRKHVRSGTLDALRVELVETQVQPTLDMGSLERVRGSLAKAVFAALKAAALADTNAGVMAGVREAARRLCDAGAALDGDTLATWLTSDGPGKKLAARARAPDAAFEMWVDGGGTAIRTRELGAFLVLMCTPATLVNCQALRAVVGPTPWCYYGFETPATPQQQWEHFCTARTKLMKTLGVCK